MLSRINTNAIPSGRFNLGSLKKLQARTSIRRKAVDSTIRNGVQMKSPIRELLPIMIAKSSGKPDLPLFRMIESTLDATNED